MAVKPGVAWLGPTLGVYAAALAVGYAGFLLHIPLWWMLGPMLTAAAFSIGGVRPRVSDRLRRIGQMMVGASVGLNFSGPVLAELVRWFPLMILAASFAILASCVGGALFARFARIDPVTAYFASLPGGLAEMGNVGSAMGGRTEIIALLQTLRIALVVLTLPPILLALGTPDFSSLPAAGTVSYASILVLAAGSAIFSWCLGLLRLNNPYMIGAVIFTAILSTNDVVVGRMPTPVFALAQLLLGFAVGCRFNRAMLAEVPRVTVVGLLFVVFIMAVMAMFAWLSAWAAGLDFSTALLATSPGGMAEMTVTAQALHLAVPLVLSFQVVRGLMVNGLASHVYVLLTKLGFFRFMRRLLG